MELLSNSPAIANCKNNCRMRATEQSLSASESDRDRFESGRRRQRFRSCSAGNSERNSCKQPQAELARSLLQRADTAPQAANDKRMTWVALWQQANLLSKRALQLPLIWHLMVAK